MNINIIDGPNGEFAMRILQARTMENLTQEQLGKLVDIDKRSISLYENGHMFPRSETIRRLAKHLQVDPVWLATGGTKSTHQYLANQREKTPEMERKVELLFIENWKHLSSGPSPMSNPRYSPNPRYGLESSILENFVPVAKTFFDLYRAVRYPGAYPSYRSYPADSILIFDAGPIAVEQIDTGADVLFRFRGNENEPGLRRLAREPGLSEPRLISLDPAVQAKPIPLDELDIEIIGVVVTQIIQRRVHTRSAITPDACDLADQSL